MKFVDKACRYTRALFIRAYSESPSIMESLLKDFRDTAKRSADYGPETMEPFINSFIFFMRYDARKKTTYLKKIFGSARPVIIRAMRSDQEEAIENYFDKLSSFEVSIKDNQNFYAAQIYVTALRETLQDLLRYETKEKDKFIWTIFFRIKEVFSDFLEVNEVKIQESGVNKLSTLRKVIEESLYVGYNLIVKDELYFFDKYLEMLERMYSNLDRIKEFYYPTDEPYELKRHELQRMIRKTLEDVFSQLLFKLGVFALMKNKHEFVAKILSRDEIGKHIMAVDKKIHEAFVGKYQPEKYVVWALGDLIRVLGPIGEIAREREVIQFYLLIRSRALFKQLKSLNRQIWDYPSSKLRKTLKRSSEWLFFEKKKPEKFSSKWRKVPFVSEFAKGIKSLNSKKIEAKGCTDFPDYMRIAKIFDKRNDLFLQAADGFTNSETISREAFGGALEQFLEITIHFLEEICEVWKGEKKRIERSFPIIEKMKESAKTEIREALNAESVFRKAVKWKESDERMLQETEKLSEVLLKRPERALYLKDLRILMSFVPFNELGRKTAKNEDEEILCRILEKNIKKEEMSLMLNSETISRFLERLGCKTLIIITGRDVRKDFWDSKEIQHLRSIDSVYEVSIDEEIRAFIYRSNVFENKTLIFAKDQFLEILYLERENIEIRYPEEIELSEGEIKEDFQMIVISQRRGLRFLDVAKAIIVEHELFDDG